MKLTPFIAPVLGIVVTTSATIAFDGLAKQVIPTDLKAIPAFGIKLGVAVVGGLIAGKLAQTVVDNVESVITTVTNQEEAEEVISEEVLEEN